MSRLIDILQNKVNSGLLSCDNHSQDNGFFEDTIEEVERALNKSGYIPLGISKHVPFSNGNQSIAFVFSEEDEIKWIHLPLVYYFSLLENFYGREKAESIYDSIMEDTNE